MQDSRIAEVIDNFSFLDDWDERFRYLIDLGRKLPPMDEALKTEETKVRGCTSQVWIIDEVLPGTPPRLQFRADSDAHIVKGLIAVLLSIYDNRSPEEILAVDIKSAIGELGFAEHLSPNRANGLFSMVERIRQLALQEVGQELGPESGQNPGDLVAEAPRE